MIFFRSNRSNSRDLEARDLEARNLEAYTKAKNWFENIYFKLNEGNDHSYTDPRQFIIGVNGPEKGKSLTKLGETVLIFNRAINNTTNSSYRGDLIDAYNRLYFLYSSEYINAFESQIDKYEQIFIDEQASNETFFSNFYKNRSMRKKSDCEKGLDLIAKYREEKEKDTPDISALSYLIYYIKLQLGTIDMRPKLKEYNDLLETSDDLKAWGKRGMTSNRQ